MEGKKMARNSQQLLLASNDTYKRALCNLEENHTFSKIFLIEENFKVTEIHSNEYDLLGKLILR